MFTGIILIVFKIEENIPKKNDRLKKISNCCNIVLLFKSFINLVGILLDPLLLPKFKEEIMLETSILSAGVVNL